MITKIFYSLVLFPNIVYKKKLKSWFILIDIFENNLWSFKLLFKKWDTVKELIFYHIDFKFKKDNKKTKNWNIYSEDKELLIEIFNIINKSDKKDFNFFKEKEFYNKIPFWTVLAITSKCNLFCNYCFNDYDYPLETRNKRKWLTLKQYKQIIDELYNAWTRDIIITWWEPFVYPYLWDILDYLKEKNIFIRINTNWSLLSDRILKKLNNNYSLDLMVSMHEFNNKDYYELNKKWASSIYSIKTLKKWENKFNEKTIFLKNIKNYKNLNLNFLTILTAKNILHLENIYKYVLNNFEIKNWDFFRLYSTKKQKWISKSMITLAIAKIYKLNKKYNTNFKIVDSVPFCVTKNIKIAREVIDWELSPNHNIKTIITTDWNVQIMSAFDTNLWSIFKYGIKKIWQWKYVQDMLNNWFLPEKCNNCKYKDECRWWSRMDANIYNWSYNALDPLWDINNKIEI